MDIESIRKTVLEDLKQADQSIVSSLYSEVELIGNISNYLINSGGKRLRPLIVILFARAFGYKENKHITLANVIEFIHSATLLHDDVVDHSPLRRGNKTANQKWGNEAAVLVGDFLYSRAFQMMVEVNSPDIFPVIANATNKIAEGEVMQLLNLHDASLREKEYFKVIKSKTATLFSAGCEIAAIISNTSSQMRSIAKDFGQNFGIAYQLIDDVLDYSAQNNQFGKNLGQDLCEGKLTLPLIRLLEIEDQKTINEVTLAIKSKNTDTLDYALIKDKMISNGCMEYCINKVDCYTERSLQLLHELPDTKYRKSLIELTMLAAKRQF